MREATRTRQVLKQIDQAKRREEVVERLRAGATLGEIASVYGVTEGTARKWRLNALEQSQRDLEMTTDGYRLAQVQRREELIEAYYPAAIKGDREAAKLVMQLFEQLERLLGLNVPIEKEVSHQTVYVLNLPGAEFQMNALPEGGDQAGAEVVDVVAEVVNGG